MVSIIEMLHKKIEKIKSDNNKFNNLLPNSNTFTNLKPLQINNNLPNEYIINKIISECPDINKEKATLINNLIPIDETYLMIVYAKEIKSNKEFYIIPTNKYIWIANQNEFVIFSYPNESICSIVKNILMGKVINLNNIILEVTGKDDKINKFINIINDPKYRQDIINEETSYLCGLIPKIQILNNIKSGITIDNNNNLVLHNRQDNYKCNPKDINNYELLFDNNIIYSKILSESNRVTTQKSDCYVITLRIKIKDELFIMPILEPNTLNTKYTKNDEAFIKAVEFSNKIMDYLKNLSNN